MLFCAGLLAAMSLVWQQQATLASFVDTEFAYARFEAATLEPITPEFTTTAATATGTWTAASGSWATPAYRSSWSTSASGSGTTFYTGSATTATHRDGAGTPSDQSMTFTAVAAGATHACGISRGKVFCWGSNGSGQLGLGHTTSARVPTEVTGGDLSGKVTTAITAGTNFTCALAEGRAFCWGLGTDGQLGNGGQSSSTTPKQVNSLTRITAISAGTAHACAVAAGKAYCWGQGSSGQLGDGGSSRKENPTAVKADGALAGRAIAAISAGGTHSCAVADGRAYCWGLNGDGQLGDNSTSQRLVPTAVDASGELMGRSVSAISAGASHSCAIADGKAFCWGRGEYGRLGNAGTATSLVPARVVATTMSAKVTAISAGSTHSCAVASGKAYCWGAGASYGLGNNNTGNQSSPVAANGDLNGRTVTDISSGTNFGCAATFGSSPVACWGLGSSYQLGDDSNANNTTPKDVTLSGPACPDGSVRTSAKTCSLVQGTAYYYQLGYTIGTWDAPDSDVVKVTTKTRDGVDPTVDTRTADSITLKWESAPEPRLAYPEYTLQRSESADHSDPVTLAVSGAQSFTDVGALAPTRDFTEVAAGDAHSCGIVADDLYCWGFNQYGQLGLGTTTASSIPAKVSALDDKKVTAVAAGQNHTCAIADGKVYCWGRGDSGQLGFGNNQGQTSPVLVRNQDGLTATSVSTGTNHTCAIADGKPYCWGLNGNGQLGNGNTSSSNVPVAVSASGEMGSRTVFSIGAGGAHTCAVADNNRAYCWGNNSSSQLGSRYCALELFGICFSYDNRDRTTSVAVEASGNLTTSTTAITAGSAHTCAIAADKAYCWGKGDSGQLGSGSSPASTRTPQAVSSSMSGAVSRLSAGANHTCAIAAKTAYCWGLNGSSQLGNASTTNSNTPVAVTANGGLKGADVTSLTAGTAHGCLVSGGAASCWGSGDNGRLGQRATTGSGYPVTVLADARCAAGSVALGDGTCSLAAGTTYRYRITYTLDGNTTTSGRWVDIKTTD